MSYCGPTNAVPSCNATPSVGFGSRYCGRGRNYYGLGYDSCGLGYSGCGLGYSGYGHGYCGYGQGYSGYGLGHSGYGHGYSGYGLGDGSTVAAACLGIVPGAHVSCITQLPPTELTVQPEPLIVTIPGPIMVPTPEPVQVGGFSPCSNGPSSGFGFRDGFGSGGVSCIDSYRGYGHGLSGAVGSRGGTCYPCY